MQDLSDDKHEEKDAETTQTCKLKRRLHSVLSDPQRRHLLSRERNTTRRAVPTTADSESDDLTENVSMGHCVHVLSIMNQKLVSSEGDIVVLKQSHTGKNWHVFCFQSVNADPCRRTRLLREPCPVTISKTEPWYSRESTSTRESEEPCFTASTKICTATTPPAVSVAPQSKTISA